VVVQRDEQVVETSVNDRDPKGQEVEAPEHQVGQK
jgi:hypothetical protein